MKTTLAALRMTSAAGLLAIFAMGTAHADSLKVLHNFSGKDGLAPTGMVQASDGNFYGATTSGGAVDKCLPPDGCGTLFRMDMTGQLKRLHVFHKTDGFYPSGLVEGPNGKLYGATREGGQKGAVVAACSSAFLRRARTSQSTTASSAAMIAATARARNPAWS